MAATTASATTSTYSTSTTTTTTTSTSIASSTTSPPHPPVPSQDDRLDYAIAKHILAVHRNKEEAQAAMVRPDYTTSELQRYIKYARTIKPTLGDEAARQLGAMGRASDTPRTTASARPTPPPHLPLLLTSRSSLPLQSASTVSSGRRTRRRPTRPRTASPSASSRR